MASATPQGAKLLFGLKRAGKFDKGLATQLPEAYKKFWNEWRNTKPTAVHYIPKEGKWERDELTGVVRPIQNVPLPVLYPKEHNQGIWGGEGIIKGFQKRTPYKRRVPHFWVPILKRSVVRSDILNEYMSVTLTDKTMELIHESHGFDHYLLKTPACDLKSTLALTLKRKLLQALQAGCPNLMTNPTKQSEVLNEYTKYLEQYTPEEIEWYGLTFNQAIRKIQKQIEENNPVIPHKIQFRSKLIEQLKQAGLMLDGKDSKECEVSQPNLQESPSWLSKINPFSKKQET